MRRREIMNWFSIMIIREYEADETMTITRNFNCIFS